MSTTQGPNQPRFRITAAGLLAALGLLGIVCWGVAFAFASGFYGRFGANLRDVGYTQQDAVTATALIMAAGVSVLLLLVILVGLPFLLYRAIRARRAGKGRTPKSPSKPLTKVLLVCALGVFAVAAITAMDNRGSDMRRPFAPRISMSS